MIFIHYGSSVFDPNKFKEVKNSNPAWYKPLAGTGLWASPVNSEWGWIDWCEAEQFGNSRQSESFKFELSDDSRIYTIDSLSDLKRLPTIKSTYGGGWHGLNFEKIAESFDAILLTIQGESETRFSRPFTLYGWDCECLLVLNGRKIKQLTEVH